MSSLNNVKMKKGVGWSRSKSKKKFPSSFHVLLLLLLRPRGLLGRPPRRKRRVDHLGLQRGVAAAAPSAAALGLPGLDRGADNASGADDSAGHLAVRPLWLSRHVVEAGDVALFERTREEGVGKGVVDQGGDGPLEGAGTCVVFFCCYCFLFER